MPLPPLEAPERILADRIERFRRAAEAWTCAGLSASLVATFGALWIALPRSLSWIALGLVAGSTLVPAAYFAWISRYLHRGGAWRPLPFCNMLIQATLVTSVVAILSWGGSADAALAVPPFGYALAIALSALSLKPWLCLAAGLASAAQLLALYHGVLVSRLGPTALAGAVSGPASVWIRAGLLALAGGALAVSVLAARRILAAIVRDLAERDRMRATFGRYVTPEQARAAFPDGKDPAPERRTAAFLAASIRGFSEHAEGGDAKAAFEALYAWLRAVHRIVEEEGGVVSRTLPDGLLASFGAPLPLSDEAYAAVRAAFRIRDETRAVLPAGLSTSVGIHRGPAIGGIAGPEGRSEYLLAGSAAAASIEVERLGRSLGTEVLASREAMQALGGRVIAVPRGEHTTPAGPLSVLAVRVFSPTGAPVAAADGEE